MRLWENIQMSVSVPINIGSVCDDISVSLPFYVRDQFNTPIRREKQADRKI